MEPVLKPPDTAETAKSSLWLRPLILVGIVALGAWFVVGRGGSPLPELQVHESLISNTPFTVKVAVEPGHSIDLHRLWAALDETVARTLAAENTAEEPTPPERYRTGYAVDATVPILMAAGVHDYMIDLGGTVRARGLSSRALPWRIAVNSPDPKASAPYKTIILGDQALASSGTVNVVADSAVLAETWAARLSAMEVDVALQTATEKGLDALFIIKEADGSLRDRMTPSFGQRIYLHP